MPFLAPLIGGVVGAIGSFFTGLGILGKIVIGIGLNLAASYLQKKAAEKAARDLAGVSFEVEYGENVSRQVPVGLFGIAGHDCYINTWGKGNRWLQNLFILGDWPGAGLTDRVGVNGEWFALGPEDGDKGRRVLGEWDGLLWIKYLPGSLTAEADASLIASSNPGGRWTPEHRGIGMPGVIVTLLFDQEKNNQMPELFFESLGSVFYDWRKDSSVGGSGNHRWNDVTTWEATRNPIVALYNYMRGLRVGADLFCGMGIPSFDLPLSRWSLAAAICDEMIDGERRYEVSAIINCGPDATHKTNVESLLKACGGYMIDGVDGIWPVVGSDQPIVATLTDDDLVQPVRGKFQRWRSQGELVNSIAGNHPSPQNLWAMEGYPEQVATGFLASDRRSRDLPMDFPMVTSKRQAAQLASIYLMENRLEATATQTFRPRWMGIEAGDWIRWNSRRYGDFTFLVTNSMLVSLDGDGPRNVSLNLQQRSGAIYDPVAKPDDIVPPIPGAAPDYLAAVENFRAFPAIIVSESGAKYVAIRTFRDAITDPTVTAVQFRYWPLHDPTAVFYDVAPVDVLNHVLAEGLVSKTRYRVQTRLITDPPRTVAWAEGEEVLTDDQPYTDVVAELENVDDDIRDVLADAINKFEEARTLIERVAHDAAMGTGQNVVDRKIYTQQIENAFAQIVEEKRLRADADNALAEITSTVQAQINDPATGLQANADGVLQLSGQVNNPQTGLEALATAILGVEASIGNVLAGGLISFEAQVPPPNGVLAQINILARASVGDQFVQSGLIIQVYQQGGTIKSRITIAADQFVVATPGGDFLPLVWNEGVLKLMEVVLGTLKFDELQSNNNKLRLRGHANYADVRIFT